MARDARGSESTLSAEVTWRPVAATGLLIVVFGLVDCSDLALERPAIAF